MVKNDLKIWCTIAVYIGNGNQSAMEVLKLCSRTNVIAVGTRKEITRVGMRDFAYAMGILMKFFS